MQAYPDPLVGASAFYIEPIHFDPPMIGQKLEAEWQAEKTPDQRESWRVDKADTATRYSEGLASEATHLRFLPQPAPGVFIVRPIVPFIEPGFYAYISMPTQVRMRVQVLSSDGALIDEIAIQSAIPASLFNPASGTRLRQAGEDLGHVTGQYLSKRTGAI